MKMAPMKAAASRKFSIGEEVARIELLDMAEWKSELAKIDSDQDRQAVRSDLKTIYKLRRADEINN